MDAGAYEHGGRGVQQGLFVAADVGSLAAGGDGSVGGVGIGEGLRL
ncbi:hypothetical protein SVIO_027300 [Streptomyces violaceusniger]|uniref:Uncharacterized protein n=1 Tax=Streptomyces violaceusniger TaxID=68280 RepID=A0A4D4L030_STRVO|nr:hypothetical protein SVIO_027300 [Streptomyces violaceusniger]